MINLSKFRSSNNEIAETKEALQNFKKEISSATLFVKKIEKGELEIPYPGIDDDQAEADSLSGSLISLRNQLKSLNKTETQRKWITEGLALFSEVLRKNQHDLDETCYDVLCNLIKYINANQGGIYVVNQEKEVLELRACYAFDRKKYVDQTFSFGEGLVGQVYLEKETLLLLDVPDNYLNITSGLGEAPPKSIIIVPLKVNDKVSGIIELASFNNFEPYQVEFLEKLGENIASVISIVKINQKTQSLLEQSQLQTESLRSQEEEMRQNMEELSATQEEMQRIMKEIQDQEQFMNNLIDSTTDIVFAIDKNHKLLKFNKAFSNNIQKHGRRLKIGQRAEEIFEGESLEFHKEMWAKALSGEFTSTLRSVIIGSEEHIMYLIFSPLKDKAGNVNSIGVFGKDVTEQELLKRKNDEILRESQLQNEALKAQEEEMRQSVEELHATQEEMQRIMGEVQEQEQFMNNIINASTDTIIVLDSRYRILKFNNAFYDNLTAVDLKVEKHVDVFTLLTPEERGQHKEYYDRVFKGETFQVTEYINAVDSHFVSSYSPIINEKGEVYACSVFAKDVTEIIRSKEKVDELLMQSQIQSEVLQDKEKELRENFDALQLTQDEMRLKAQDMTNRMTAIDESGIASIEFDLEGNVITANTNFLKLLGYELEDIKGAHHEIFMSETEAAKESYKEFWKNLANGIAFSGEYERVKKDGTTIHLHGSYSILKDEKGNPKGVITLVFDISEIKKAQYELEIQSEQIKQQEELMVEHLEMLTNAQDKMSATLKEVETKEAFIKSLMNACTDSIFVLDKNYCIIQFNNTFSNALAASNLQAVVGLDIFSILPEDAKQTEKEYYDKALGGETLQETNYISSIDACYLSTYTPLKDKDNNITSCAVFAKDITELIRSKQQVESLLNESQQNSKALTEKEKELLKNVKELKGTQEEIKRKAQEIESRMTAIDESGIARIEFDLKGNIISANRNFLLLMGFNESEVKGKHHQLFVNKSFSGSEEYKQFWDELSKGNAQFGEYERVKKSGERICLHGSYSILKDKNGKPKRIIKYASDITASKLANEKLEKTIKENAQQEKLLLETQENLQNQLATTSMMKFELDARMAVLNECTLLSESDKNGNITYINDKFCEVSQFSREELIGKTHSIIRHPETSEEFYNNFWKTVNAGQMFKGYLKNRRKDGSTYYVHLVVSPVVDESGVPIKFIEVRYVIENTEIGERLLKEQLAQYK
ncbi:PAS domain S-box protein [Chondrinema litorale]|uniref:PAS domain S-box protein n=1 Tax=Chondrinema litorale TaxID=2994555 RepID=UPI00254285F1|nr:PAS domain S-box protein [Chondrinema litorale]UZR98254.1 PAS domain S-box protein [Chondrinema litorale]